MALTGRRRTTRLATRERVSDDFRVLFHESVRTFGLGHDAGRFIALNLMYSSIPVLRTSVRQRTLDEGADG